MSDFWSDPLSYCHTSCVRTAKALARLRGCAGSLEPSLVAYVIRTLISRAGSFKVLCQNSHAKQCDFSTILQMKTGKSRPLFILTVFSNRYLKYSSLELGMHKQILVCIYKHAERRIIQRPAPRHDCCSTLHKYKSK